MTDTDLGTIALDEIPVDDQIAEFFACEEGDNFEELTGVFDFGTTSRHVLATWLPAAFDKWGVKYKKVAGWESRGRPLTSGHFDPNGSLTHHTGSKSSATNPAPSLRTVIEGRTDLKGPLCQVSTDYNGLTYIVAAGRANHAGSARAAMGNPSGDGNAMYIGNEVQTNGTQKMPGVQYEAVVLVAAAIADHFNQTTGGKVGLHATTSLTGKWDLGAGTMVPGVAYDISKFRAAVTARLKAGPPSKPAPTPPTAPVASQESDDVFVFQIPDHPDPKVASAKVVSNGFQARVLSHLGWVRLNGAHKYQTGKELFVVGVKDFSGIALEWVGPPILQSDGKPFPLPADIKAAP